MLTDLITSITTWIRKGYPHGIPATDFPPLLALLQRSLTPDEVTTVMGSVIRDHPDGSITHEAVANAVTLVKDAPPNDDDINLVAARLAEAGWPLATPENSQEKVASESHQQRRDIIQRVLGWLRAGYPDGIPATDYIPVLAILQRRLSDEEVKEVAQAIIDEHLTSGSAVITTTDLQARIRNMTHVAVDEADLDRVRARLAGQGWPLENVSPHELGHVSG